MSVNLGREIARDNQNVFRRSYIGLVVNNKDPKKLQRVQVRIRELHMNIPDENLPWCMKGPGADTGHSPGGGMGAHGVPAIGAKVSVTFMDNSPYFPQYGGAPDSEDTKLGEEFQGDDYEHVSGNIDQAGNRVFVNTKEGSEHVEFNHKTGTTYKMDKDGNYHLDSKANVYINSGEAKPRERPKIPDAKNKVQY